MKKKNLLFVLIVLMLVLICAGCVQKGKDGVWVKTQIIEADGTVLKGEDAGPYEAYTIEGDRAWYSTKEKVNGKEVGMELVLVEKENGTYDFRVVVKGKVSERLSLLKDVKFDGNKMTANMPGDKKFVFERQK